VEEWRSGRVEEWRSGGVWRPTLLTAARPTRRPAGAPPLRASWTLLATSYDVVLTQEARVQTALDDMSCTIRQSVPGACLGRALHARHDLLVQKVRQQRQAVELRTRGVNLAAAAAAGSRGPRQKQRHRTGPATKCFETLQGAVQCKKRGLANVLRVRTSRAIHASQAPTTAAGNWSRVTCS